MYFRYHAKYLSPKTGEPVGFFVAVWHLVSRKMLTDEEEREYWRLRKYTEEVLPIPPFYSEGNSLKAVTWFKDNDKVKDLMKELDFYFNMLQKYEVEFEMIKCDNPGKVIYEDDFQVGVVRAEDRIEVCK